MIGSSLHYCFLILVFLQSNFLIAAAANSYGNGVSCATVCETCSCSLSYLRCKINTEKCSKNHFIDGIMDSLKKAKNQLNNLTKNCQSSRSTPHVTATTQEVSLDDDDQEMTTPQDHTITSACIEKSSKIGQKFNVLVVIGLSAIIILQTAGLIFLKRQNSQLSSKAKSNYICLENIAPPPAPSTTTITAPDRQDTEAEEINEMYGQTEEAGGDYYSSANCEEKYYEI